MRNGFLGSIAGLFAGATLSLAQAPLPTGPAGPMGGAEPSVMQTVATSSVDCVSPYNANTAFLKGAELPSGPPSTYGCCGGVPVVQPGLPQPSPYQAEAGVAVPPCLNVEPQPTPYLPRPMPPAPSCGCKPQVHYEEPSAQVSLYVTGGMEYLLWWVKNGPVSVPLVTTAPGTTLPTLTGAGTSVLFGDKSVDYGTFSGARLSLDFWHDESREAGVDVSLFGLLNRDKTFSAASDGGGNPALGVPFQNAASGQQSVSLVSFPGAFAGSVTEKSSSDLVGVEGNLLWRAPVIEGRQGGVWLLAGFRFLDLAEDLSLTQNSTILPGAVQMQANGGTVVLQGGIAGPPAGVLAPTQVVVIDQFRTRNDFYGAQLGLNAEVQSGDAFLDFTGKIGLGMNHEVLMVNGATGYSPGGPGGTAGGLFAVSSNLGQSSRNWFAAVPEVGIKAGYYLTHHIRATVGYDFLLMSAVLRPGSQIDPVVNPGLVPSSLVSGAQGGPDRPALLHNESTFWAQGVTFGLDFSY